MTAQLRDLTAEAGYWKATPQPSSGNARRSAEEALAEARASITTRVIALEEQAAAAGDLDTALRDAELAVKAEGALQRSLDLAARSAGNEAQATDAATITGWARELADEIRLRSEI